METQLNNAINWLKEARINKKGIDGVLTGSCLLGEWWEGMDVDVFVFSSAEFKNLLWKLYYYDNFQILDPREQWKFDKFIYEEEWKTKHTSGVHTMKFMYNACIPINIIFKSNKKNIFDVLSSFDMSMVARGYDLRVLEYVELPNDGSIKDKIVTWNKWNKQFTDPTIWSVSKMLRQVDRIIKYHKRGYNTDAVAVKYIELIDKILSEQNIFDSPKYGEILKRSKDNFTVIKGIFKIWLDTHEVTDEQLETIQTKIKEI